MTLRTRVEGLFDRQVSELTGATVFEEFESGAASAALYDAVVANLVRTHARSPQLVAFLYALAPPAAAGALAHNLLEELGLDAGDGVAHPALLGELARAAGLGGELPALETQAAADLREVTVAPMLYGSLAELGLAAFGEILAFEYMLARVAGRMAAALAAHRGLPASALAWFTHHAEVDIRHAEEGLEALDAYVRYYGLAEDHALAILELVLRENVFLRRYFRGWSAPVATGGRARCA